MKQAAPQASDLPLKQAEVSDTTLAYIEQGEGEPVVFIHGALGDFRAWLPQVRVFSKNYRAISYSRRYHRPNESIRDHQLYSRTRQMQDLIEFLRALNLNGVHLVGHSYGGAIALLAALQHPELVSSLVLGEPSPFIDLLEDDGLSLLMQQQIGFNEAVFLAHSERAEWAVRHFWDVTAGTDDMLDRFPLTARSILMENAATLAPMLESYYISPPVGYERLRNLKAPTLLITGEFSPEISYLSSEQINNCLPNSEIIILGGTSHGLQLDNPDGFNRMVLNFLANQ